MTLDDAWIARQLAAALDLRARAFDAHRTGFRLVSGEGDGLPGLVLDVYANAAVIKLDGGGPEAFYRPEGIAGWLAEQLPLDHVVLRFRERGRGGEALVGALPKSEISFLENGRQFSADVVRGQKTGFFLDQRDNRALVRRLAQGRRVLNLFSFNGGFSIAAGRGGAAHVSSVDIARPAIEAAERLWRENDLDGSRHESIAADCFEFLEAAAAEKRSWDLVICDPPSFAPNAQSRAGALGAYGRLAQLASRVTAAGGLLALASCSSHVDRDSFLSTNFDALGRARRSATLLADLGLPIDHPTPLAMPELRYLKFLLLRLDGSYAGGGNHG